LTLAAEFSEGACAEKAPSLTRMTNMNLIVYLFISVFIAGCVVIFIRNFMETHSDDEFAEIIVNKFLKPQGENRYSRDNAYVRAIHPDVHKQLKLVTTGNTPLYIKRGWSKTGNEFSGYYRTRFGAWKGLIIRRGDVFHVYIFNPPIDEIKKHSRWPCFHDKGKGKWSIHLAMNPMDGDANAIIICVENLLVESFRK
jgi:hypothetical protein